MIRAVLIFFALLLHVVSAGAKEAVLMAEDPEIEARLIKLSSDMRCLVCQNQTIADSNAELAIDLRNQVREKLEQGMSDQDVIDYMVQRYGDFILYRPPLKMTTWLLWFGPFILLIGGIIFLGLKLRRSRAQVDALPEADMQRAAALLGATPTTKETK